MGTNDKAAKPEKNRQPALLFVYVYTSFVRFKQQIYKASKIGDAA